MWGDSWIVQLIDCSRIRLISDSSALYGAHSHEPSLYELTLFSLSVFLNTTIFQFNQLTYKFKMLFNDFPKG